MERLPRTPVLIPRLVEDPDGIRRLVDANGPYWPVQRYLSNGAEYASLSGEATTELVVGPVFRGNWAIDGVCEAGVEWLLHHPVLVDAAQQVFGAEIVRPHTIYVNLTWQLPFAQGAGHTDVPAFRGFDRSEHPITLLTIMGASGLFEAERVKIATAVAWYYQGRDGGFEYWPDGPDAPSVIHEGAIDNTAVLGDNDFMWHRVRPTGRPEDGMVTLELDSELRRAAESGTWEIVTGDHTVARFGSDRLRTSLSWKANVFDSEDDRRRYDDHTDDLSAGEVVERFAADLTARGIDVEVPEDPERDPEFISVLANAYVRYPSTTAPSA